MTQQTQGEIEITRADFVRTVYVEFSWQREESDAPWECVDVRARFIDVRPNTTAHLTDSELWEAKEKFCP